MNRGARRLCPGLLWGLLASGCLEKTTGEEKPLDPRFVEQTADGSGTAGIAAEGPTVTVRGTVASEVDHAVDIDVSIADPAAPGGRRQLGKVLVDQPGPFEVPVPAATAGVTLAIFQDLEGDGPSSADPYASLVLDPSSADVEGLAVTLVVGDFAQAGGHQEAAPGAPGGGTPVAGGGTAAAAAALQIVPLSARGPVGVQPFGQVEGARVTIRGSVSSPLDAPVDLVVTLGDAPIAAGSLLLAGPGPYELVVPRAAGEISLRAVHDLAADGPDAADPSSATQVTVGELDIDGVDLALEAPVVAVRPPAVEGAPDAATPAGAGEAAVGAPPAVAHVEMPPGGSLDPTAGLAGPFDAALGPLVVVSGTVLANDELPVDLDLRVPDDEAESGVRDLGKVLLPRPGDFAIKVPAGLGDLRMEGFQDQDGDGPDADDPWGAALVDVGTADVSGVRLMLVAGARGAGAEHHAVAHSEAAEGQSVSVDFESVGRPVDPAGVGPFANHRGAMVKIRGSVQSTGAEAVDLDLWIEDPGAPGGMRNQGKVLLLSPSDFVIRVPRGAGKMAIEAYQDQQADGPTEQDLFARVDFEVGQADVEGLALALTSTGSRGGGAAVAAPPDVDRVPFAGESGPTITLSGVVRGEQQQLVFVDVRVPDPEAPGGMSQAGQLHLQGPGVFEIAVPVNRGRIELEAFQDEDRNGPDDDDPYGRLSLEVADRDLQAAIDLVVGGRALAAAAGAPGGGTQAASSGPGEGDAFPAYDGPRVTIRGQVHWAGEGRVDIDLFKTDATAPGGRTIAGKLKVAAGPFSFTAPKDFGPLELEAFVDVDGDGPSSGDPAGRYPGNPLLVEGVDIEGVEIAITGS